MNATWVLVAIWGAVGVIGLKEPGAGVVGAIFAMFTTLAVVAGK